MMRHFHLTDLRKAMTPPTSVARVGLLAFVSITSFVTATADRITPARALALAGRYVHVSHAQVRSLTAEASADRRVPYYVFNDRQGNGFVLVSGDDAMGEILAYGDRGSLDTASANPNLQYILAAYRRQADLVARRPQAARPAAAKQYKPVPALMTTEWDQVDPYNSMLPGFPYTGCVATAVAQVMYHHRWPATGKGSVSLYVSDYNTTVSADLTRSHYDWDNMLPNYFTAATEAQRAAVGLLMRDVGYACKMVYQPHQSGANGIDATKALNTNFDYNAALVNKGLSSYEEFLTLMANEFEGGFPVYMSGYSQSMGVGHAWVADGIDANGLVHMNLGWGGRANGYYSISSMNVSETGNEFGGRPMQFSQGLAVILMHPNKPGVPTIPTRYLPGHANLRFTESGSLVIKGAEGRRFAKKDTVGVAWSNIQNASKTFTGDIGIGIFNALGDLVRIAPSPYFKQGGLTEELFKDYEPPRNLGQDQSIVDEQTVSVSFDSLASGYYTLNAIYNERIDSAYTTWTAVNRAPIIEVEVTADSVRISMQSENKDGYQFCAQPITDGALVAGDANDVQLNIKSLRLLPTTGSLRIRLVDAGGHTAFEQETDKEYGFDGFATVNYSVTLNLPAQLAAGRYRVEADVHTERYVGDRWQYVYIPVRPIHDAEPACVDVITSDQDKRLTIASAWPYNSLGDPIKSAVIDLGSTTDSYTGIIASFHSTRSQQYDTRINFYFENVATRQRIRVGEAFTLHVAPGETVTLRSDPVRRSALIEKGIVNGRHRLVVTTIHDGTETDIPAPDGTDGYFVTFKGSPNVEPPTGITDVTTTAPCSLSVTATALTARADGLEAVSLYTATGRLVGTARPDGAGTATLALTGLPGGVYVVKMVTRDGTFARSIAK